MVWSCIAGSPAVWFSSCLCTRYTPCWAKYYQQYISTWPHRQTHMSVSPLVAQSWSWEHLVQQLWTWCTAKSTRLIQHEEIPSLRTGTNLYEIRICQEFSLSGMLNPTLTLVRYHHVLNYFSKIIYSLAPSVAWWLFQQFPCNFSYLMVILFTTNNNYPRNSFVDLVKTFLSHLGIPMRWVARRTRSNFRLLLNEIHQDFSAGSWEAVIRVTGGIR